MKSINNSSFIPLCNSGGGGFMKRTFMVLASILLITSNLHAGNGDLIVNGKIGVGTSTPAESSAIDVNSTTKGFLPPRMTDAQRNAIAAPAQGLLIFNTSDGTFNYYDGSVWVTLVSQTTINYINMGEDFYEYWNTDGGANSLHAPHDDTCDGNNSSPYVCAPNEEKNCLDSAANPNNANWATHHRTVNCRKATIQGDPGAQKMTTVAVEDWIYKSNRFIDGPNTGSCSLPDNCNNLIFFGSTWGGGCGSHWEWRVNYEGTVYTISVYDGSNCGGGA